MTINLRKSAAVLGIAALCAAATPTHVLGGALGNIRMMDHSTHIGSATGGAGAGKIRFNEFSIKKTTDAASPSFFKQANPGSKPSSLTICKYCR